LLKDHVYHQYHSSDISFGFICQNSLKAMELHCRSSVTSGTLNTKGKKTAQYDSLRLYRICSVGL